MKRIAVLMDGAFVAKVLTRNPDPLLQASKVTRLAELCLEPSEELYRIYYYDCEPFSGSRVDLSGHRINFGQNAQFIYQEAFLKALETKPFTAIRLGQVKFRGWKPRKHVANRVRQANGQITLRPNDFEPAFQQKGVDMRIGLDVATLSMDRLVERIVLVTADSDFIPAMKLARREGIQIALATLKQSHVPDLLKHADLYRYPDLSQL